jgi:Abhydrolase family/Concanavalin A-like lectin/glucanases superfamily
MQRGFAIALAAFSFSGLALHAAADPSIQWSAGEKPREFLRADDVIVLDASTKLNGAEGATVESWVLVRRIGEQVFVARGLPEIGPGGERFHRPAPGWVKFFIGTDQRGFLMGCINGNSRMPFPLVTIEQLAPGEWHQIVVVKQPDGFQRFHHNGALIHSDTDAETAGNAWPFRDEDAGEPVRLSVPLGGALGEVAVWARALSNDEIRANWEAKRPRYVPHSAPQPAKLRPMHEHPGIKPLAADAAAWERERARILAEWKKLLGPMPEIAPSLDAQTLGETDCGHYVRRKVSIQVQPNDRMPCWLLIPKTLPAEGRAPAVICFYGTTSGAGKDTTVGLSGAKPGSQPQRNRAFAVDMVEAGFVALAPDFLRDGERLPPSGRPYDTQDFYKRFPDWSCVGKDCWDVQRAVDYLATLPFVQSDRIGMVGHSYGGHTTIFAASLDPRIRAVFANGPVSDFVLHGAHWAVPKGAGASQSLPALRPFLLEHRAPPVSFAQVTALIAPRPLWVNQAAGEWRPNEEENAAVVMGLYQSLGEPERVRYMWCAGDHDFPPAVRTAAVEWFRKWLSAP